MAGDRVLILGGNGMLGHRLWLTLSARFDTFVTLRGGYRAHANLDLFDQSRVAGSVDAADFDSMLQVWRLVRPTVVVNCIGIIKQAAAAKDPIPSLTVNALFPHRVAALCESAGARLIHISTDCVFAGTRGMYQEDDVPDAEDLYGRTKLLGEVVQDGCLTLRTSIIGRELSTTSGLVEWFLSQGDATVYGYERAIFSGLTTSVLSQVIGDLIEDFPHLSGLYHVSAEPIDKFRLLSMVRNAFDTGASLQPDSRLQIDRSLDSSRFRTDARFVPPSWENMIHNLAADAAFYIKWR